MKFDSKLKFEEHRHGIVSCVSQRIGILRLVKRIFVETSVLLRCYCAFALPILEDCSPVYGGQLLNVTLGLSSARCVWWPGLALIRVCSRCVIDVCCWAEYVVQG